MTTLLARRLSFASLALLAVLPLALASCDKGGGGGGTTPEPTGDTGGGGGGETETPPSDAPKSWEEMDRQGRMEFMGTVVLPAMKEKFQAHDAGRFAEFKCDTCHGKNKQEVDFKMPNDITPLPAEGTIEAAKAMDEKMTAFLVEAVVPEMKKMSGEDDFGCFDCHLKE